MGHYPVAVCKTTLATPGQVAISPCLAASLPRRTPTGPANKEHNLCYPHVRSYESVGGHGGKPPCRLMGMGHLWLWSVLCWGRRRGQKMSPKDGRSVDGWHSLWDGSQPHLRFLLPSIAQSRAMASTHRHGKQGSVPRAAVPPPLQHLAGPRFWQARRADIIHKSVLGLTTGSHTGVLGNPTPPWATAAQGQ